MVKVSFYSYVFSIIFLLTFSAQATLKKSRKLTPYQVQIENCFAGLIPASKISDNKRFLVFADGSRVGLITY